MTDSKNQDIFQERLNRIKKERQANDADADGPASHNPFDTPRKARKSRKSSGRMSKILSLGVVLFALGGGVAYAYTQFDKLAELPLRQMANDLLLDAVARVPTTDSYDGLIESGPKERKLHDTGWVLPSPFVAAEGRSDLTLTEVAVVPAPVEGATTAKTSIKSFNLNQSCTLRRPRDGEVVRNVRLNDTAQYTRTHVFSKAELAEAVMDRIEGITRHAKHYKNAAIADGRMGKIDVFVTDTSAPVYLVLQTLNRDILWNIHLAEGVTLSHVAMIGNKSGFAAPQGDFTYEALRIEDFFDKDDIFDHRPDNDESEPCMIAPWRSAQDHWPILQKLDHKIDASHYKSQLAISTEGHIAFNRWYKKQLGVDADLNLTTAISAAHALSGPIPPNPVPLVPIEQRILHVAQNDYVAFGQEQLEAMHTDLLMTATGGDLSILKPAAVEIVGQ